MLGEVPKVEETKPQKVLTYQDLLQFENTQIYSGFGKMYDSNKETAPLYGFGTAHRDKLAKMFINNDLAKITLVGKQSIGPNYNVTDEFQYKKDPSYSVPKQIRNTLDTGPKYELYKRQDQDFDSDAADLVRRKKLPNVRIGLENRFPYDPKGYKGNPGPQYDPAFTMDKEDPPKYTFGYRRDLPGSSPLSLLYSTPNNVGPGLYVSNLELPGHSQLDDAPKYSFRKEERKGLGKKTFDKFQTYDTKQVAVGAQVNSKKPTLPNYTIGKETRQSKRVITYDKQSMPQTKIRIAPPKF